MADKKISVLDIVTGSFLSMYFPVVDPDEPLAENRNKRMTLSTVFGAVTSFSGTTLTITLIAPQLYYFSGSSACTVTLPAGEDNLINIPIAFVNNGTADLNIQGDGDTILGSDPFNIPGTYDKKQYVFTWDGTYWSVK